MQDQYIKILNKPEARHRYWHVYKSERDFFPETDELFKLKFHENVYELKVNHKNDIMTGKLYEHYKFFEGNEIILKKKGNLQYELVAKDAKPW